MRSITGSRSLSQPVTLLAGVANHVAPSNDVSPVSSTDIKRDLAEGQVLALADEVRDLRRRNAELTGLRGPGGIASALGQVDPQHRDQP